MKKHLIWAVLFFILFAALTAVIMKVDVQPVGPENSSVGLSGLNLSVRGMIGPAAGEMNAACYKVSKYLGILALLLAAGMCAVWCVLAVRGMKENGPVRSVLGMKPAFRWLPLLYLAIAVLYIVFDKVIVLNYRPVIMDKGLEASYPSTHSLMAVGILASAPVLFSSLLGGKRPLLVALNALCITGMVLIIFMRLLSGVHWFTDIVAGILLGGGLVCLYTALVRKCEKN